MSKTEKQLSRSKLQKLTKKQLIDYVLFLDQENENAIQIAEESIKISKSTIGDNKTSTEILNQEYLKITKKLKELTDQLHSDRVKKILLERTLKSCLEIAMTMPLSIKAEKVLLNIMFECNKNFEVESNKFDLEKYKNKISENLSMAATLLKEL